MTCLHPSAVLSTPELKDRFQESIARFVDLTKGISRVTAEDDIDHRIIEDKLDLLDLVDEVINDPDSYQTELLPGQPKTAIIALDAEWHGEHPENTGSYVRTIQISWAHKKAACIVLTKPGGQELEEGWIADCVEALNKMLKSTKDRLVRICMHFGVADLEWMVPLGLDIRPEFQAPSDYRKCKYLGGIDTGMATHCMEETADMSLKAQSLKHTTAPVYETALETWRESFCKEHGLKANQLEGYGECPIDVLGPYGNYDADVTRRLTIMYLSKLHKDKFGNNCWKAYWTGHRVLLPILEMHKQGFVLDKTRVDQLQQLFIQSREELRDKIRKWANWPQLNLDSPFQVRELLFGHEYNGKELVNGQHPRLRPADAYTMGLKPLLTTGKRPKEWVEIEYDADEDEDEYTASTSKAVLSMLCRGEAVAEVEQPDGSIVEIDRREQVEWVRDFRYIAQALKSVLQGPKLHKKTREPLRDKNGDVIYAGGFLKFVCDDGRLRTHLYPTKETYRWSSARPNVQALSKRREDDYKRILGTKHSYPIRSTLMAPPGYLIVEADYVGAELFGMAVLSGDSRMIDHCLRNQLPEDHPDFYDIHSHVAVGAFKLDCPPTKQGLEDIGKPGLRIAAKSVAFGVAYGRGAKAVAVALREEGVNISEREAQEVVNYFFEMYPGLPDLFAICRERATKYRWMCGVGDQYRRFPEVAQHEKKLLGEMERQGMNFPFQNMIAWAADRAVDALYTRKPLYDPCNYRLTLQIHDALLSTVLAPHAEKFVKQVLPDCMINQVPIVPRNLDGTSKPGSQIYHLGLDAEVYIHWGEVPKPNELLELGCSPTLAHWKPSPTIENGWIHGKFKTKKKEHRVWVGSGWYGE